MKAEKHLKEALKLLRKNGWIQRDRYGYAGKHDVYGALRVVVGHDAHDSPAFRALLHFHRDPIGWNDGLDRTFRDIEKWFKKAIRRVQQKNRRKA